MATPNPEGNLQDRMEAMLQLMTQRVKGEASNRDVEDAVDNILSSMGTSQKGKEPPQPANVGGTGDTVQPDLCNYDDDDDGEGHGDSSAGHSGLNGNATEKHTEAISTEKAAEEEENDETDADPEVDASYQDELEQLPMGIVGAKMMTTFGDGSRPLPSATEAALSGTRKTLQYAIMDARAVRRRAQQTFDNAKRRLARKATSVQEIQESVAAESAAPDLLYRALSGHDRLTLQPKCGFDMEQLTWLFPEEMRAYERWNEMHSEYEQSSKDDQLGEQAKPDTASKVTENEKKEDTGPVGGHLQERAEVFDVRTLHMKGDKYMKFSKVRQGSFLPRGNRSRKTASEAEWEQGRTLQRGGRTKGGSWDSMPVASVRFLHWLGFEPPTVPPPNEETTQALGFLGYDVMGRIVEKAIFLRNFERSKSRGDSDWGDTIKLHELQPNEQLTQEDIGRAMEDPDITPAALYSLHSESSKPPFQLYFGPGFEQRLELEMEEMIAAGSSTKVSQEEADKRAEDASMFSAMSSAPQVCDSISYLLGKRKANDDDGEGPNDVKRPADTATAPVKEAKQPRRD